MTTIITGMGMTVGTVNRIRLDDSAKEERRVSGIRLLRRRRCGRVGGSGGPANYTRRASRPCPAWPALGAATPI